MALSVTTLISCGLLLLLAKIIYTVVYNLFIHPLKDIPGPLLRRASLLPHTIATLKGTSHDSLYRLHQQYGEVVRIAPNDVSHTTGVVWKEVWNHNKDPEFHKMLKFRPVNGSHGFFTADRPTHRRYRQNFSNAFSQQGLLAQEKRVQDYIDLFMMKLREKGLEGPLNLVEWFNWLSFDIIGDLTLGESFNCVAETRPHPWVVHLLQSAKTGTFLTAFLDWNPGLLLDFLIPKKNQESRLRSYEYVSEKLDTRIKHTAPRGDFLDTVMARGLKSDVEATSIPDESKDAKITLNELKSVAGSIILAGSETTATLLSGVVFNLINNPEIHAQIVNEVRSKFASADEITVAAASKNVPYLLYTLDESLRMYPPVPVMIGRVVPETPEGGAEVAGRFYPSGTRIAMPAWAANYHPSNFARPNEFLPERWSSPKPKEFENDNKDAVFQPFSVGPRNCIGRNLAYAEMRVTLAKLLWWFDLTAPEAFNQDWIRDQQTFVLWEKGPLMVNVKVREDL